MANQLPYDAHMIPTELTANITEVNQRIRAAEALAGRKSGSVSLLAVSKTKPAEAIRRAHCEGLTKFGENYAQEMAEKSQILADLPLTWHFIGPIQSNKTALIAKVSDWVHSIDRIKIARRLNEHRPTEKAPLNVLIQVNTSNEDTKAGVMPEALPELAAEIAELPHLSLRGLMTIPAPASTPEQQRAPFRQLRDLMSALQHSYPDLDTLSMGMSGDLESAIAEGATIVRIGTDLFGAR